MSVGLNCTDFGGSQGRSQIFGLMHPWLLSQSGKRTQEQPLGPKTHVTEGLTMQTRAQGRAALLGAGGPIPVDQCWSLGPCRSPVGSLHKPVHGCWNGSPSFPSPRACCTGKAARTVRYTLRRWAAGPLLSRHLANSPLLRKPPQAMEPTHRTRQPGCRAVLSLPGWPHPCRVQSGQRAAPTRVLRMGQRETGPSLHEG